ncbi:MAG: Hsp20/alpha crystallin family protein [bacterium]
MIRKERRGELVPWRPFEDLWTLSDRINRFLEERWGRFGFLPRMRSIFGDSKWAPAVDVVEEADRFVVKADLPGLEKDDVKVSVEDDVLLIQGEKKTEKETKKDDYYYSERTYGSFYRSIPLPASVTGDKVKASYKKGVLEVSLPKSEQTKSKQIDIEID